MRARFAPEEGGNAVTLADFTNSGLMIPRLRGQDAPAVVQELGERLQREKCVPDRPAFVAAVLKRELLVSTEMEAGMAFPHARVPDLAKLSFALGRSDEPLAWGPMAARSVRLVFLMAVPANDFSQYLPLISGLARLSKDRRWVERLQSIPDALHMLEVLQQVELATKSRTFVK